MLQIAIIYFSHSGYTHQLAHAIGNGCSESGRAEVCYGRILGTDIHHGRFTNETCHELIDNADAVFFGSPTYMGGPAAQFKAFADATSERWETQPWRGKVAAGFTVGANPNGDQVATLQYFSILSAQHGMLWQGLDIASVFDHQGRNALGTNMGLTAHAQGDSLSASDRATAEYFGHRMTEIIKRR